MSLRTLNALVSWVNVLEILGVPVKGLGLPATVACPICRKGRLRIYEDTTLGGAWHYCKGCAHAGDMIELCAAVWECSPAVVIHRLNAKGLSLPKEATT